MYEKGQKGVYKMSQIKQEVQVFCDVQQKKNTDVLVAETECGKDIYGLCNGGEPSDKINSTGRNSSIMEKKVILIFEEAIFRLLSKKSQDRITVYSTLLWHFIPEDTLLQGYQMLLTDYDAGIMGFPPCVSHSPL